MTITGRRAGIGSATYDRGLVRVYGRTSARFTLVRNWLARSASDSWRVSVGVFLAIDRAQGPRCCLGGGAAFARLAASCRCLRDSTSLLAAAIVNSDSDMRGDSG